MHRLKKIHLLPLDASDVPTTIMSAVKIRSRMHRDGFVSSDRTEAIPAINASMTERMPIIDEDVTEKRKKA